MLLVVFLIMRSYTDGILLGPQLPIALRTPTIMLLDNLLRRL